jgi:magnesium chelatase subunit D
MATPGRRAPARTGRGRTVRALPESAIDGPLHLIATITAAASKRSQRAGVDGPISVNRSDIRRADRRGREGNLVLFVVDASGSMAARTRMSEVKGAILSLLVDAYQRRDKVGLITFRGSAAQLVLPPTTSIEGAVRRLEQIATGGRTPLAAGLHRTLVVLRAERLRDPLRRALVLIVTDGKTPSFDLAPFRTGLAGSDVMVIDCERGPVRVGLAIRLAASLGASYLRLHELTSAPLAGVVSDWRAA